MPEYIDREAVVNGIWKALYSYEDEMEAKFEADPELDVAQWFFHRIFVQTMSSIDLQVILDAPAADVRDVVRCRDCYWWAKQEDSLQGCCSLLPIYPTGAWFCGNGIREEDFLQRVRLRNIPKLGGDPDA